MNRSEAGRLGYKKSKKSFDAQREKVSRAAMHKYLSEDKHCPNCGQRISFEKRQNTFCNHSCAASYNNQGQIRTTCRKTCIWCGEDLKRAQRKYCSIDCQTAHQYRTYIDEWLTGKRSGLRGRVVAPRVRRYLYEIRGERCEVCNWAEKNPTMNKSPLDIHHIDGNPENNCLSNLKILCPNCHSLTPTYKNLGRDK